MSINNFVVDTEAQVEEVPAAPIPVKNKQPSNKTTVQEQIQEYERSRTLSDTLFKKYGNDGWDSIWRTPTIVKDTKGIKSIYIANTTFMKLVEYFTLQGQSVCDVFAPLERQEVITDLDNTTFVSNNNDTLTQLQRTYNALKASPMHSNNVGTVAFSSYQDLVGSFHLITASLPSYKDIPIKVGGDFNGTPQEYITYLSQMVNNLASHLVDDGNMVLLIKDFHDGKYIPILTLVPYIIKESACTWTYTAVVQSGTPLPEGLWIKFYQEKRFKVTHAYLIGLRKTQK